MRKLVLLDFAGPGVQDCHLLLARVQIASNECHVRASFRKCAAVGSLAIARMRSHGINEVGN